MRILWVEDFDGSDCESLLPVIFAYLPQQRCSALASYVDSIESKQQTYDAWRVWYRGQGLSEALELDVCCSKAEFDALTGESAADRYDAVLLDVNLANDFFPSSAPCDPKEGGFWLYNELIRSGFPSGRIALLTAHAGEKPVEEFRAGCIRFGHEKLESHPKVGNAASQWIKKLSCAHDRYLLLRRGALDGIDYCERLLGQHGSDAIRLNRYLGDGERRWTDDHAKDFLYSLRHLLPVRVIGSEMHLQLRGFEYVLFLEWGSANPEDGSNRYYKALGRVLKLLRNMASHSRLLEGATIGDIAFHVLASLRTTFCIPGDDWGEPAPYELRLISLVGDSKPIDPEAVSQHLARKARDARSALRAAVAGGMLSRTRKDKNGRPECVKDQHEFHRIVNEIATAQSPCSFDFVFALREAFIHEVLVDKKCKVFDNNLDNDEGKLQGLVNAYRVALQEQLPEMPMWIKATCERILSPAAR